MTTTTSLAPRAARAARTIRAARAARAPRRSALARLRALTRTARPCQATGPQQDRGLGEHARTLLDLMRANADRRGWVAAASPWAPACPTYHGPVDVLAEAARTAGTTRHDMVTAMRNLHQAGLVTPTTRPATEADGATTSPYTPPTTILTGWTLNPTRPDRHTPDVPVREGER